MEIGNEMDLLITEQWHPFRPVRQENTRNEKYISNIKNNVLFKLFNCKGSNNNWNHQVFNVF